MGAAGAGLATFLSNCCTGNPDTAPVEPPLPLIWTRICAAGSRNHTGSGGSDRIEEDFQGEQEMTFFITFHPEGLGDSSTSIVLWSIGNKENRSS